MRANRERERARGKDLLTGKHGGHAAAAARRVRQLSPSALPRPVPVKLTYADEGWHWLHLWEGRLRREVEGTPLPLQTLQGRCEALEQLACWAAGLGLVCPAVEDCTLAGPPRVL